MNRKQQAMGAEDVSERGEYAVQRNRITVVIALLLSFLLACFVWVVVMNLECTETLPLSLVDAPADPSVEYELSAEGLAVKGAAVNMKNGSIGVRIPAGAVPGESYRLTEADLVLPEGVETVVPLDLVLTVRAK